MMDQSAYLMNLTVQSVGQYFQYAVLQLSFHTDAFGQLRSGEGRAIDDNASATWWFDAWTVFYVRTQVGTGKSQYSASSCAFHSPI